MKRKLISQMCHEWRANMWMLVELVIVSVVLWAISSLFFPAVAPLFRSTAYTTDDLYASSIDYFDEENPQYREYPDSLHNQATDLQNIIHRLRRNPHVLHVGAGSNLTPYTFGYYGTALMRLDDLDTVGFDINKRAATPEAIRALGLKGVDGQTTEQLVDLLEKGKIIISETDVMKADEILKAYGNKRLIVYRDSTEVFEVGAIIPLYPRNNYESSQGGVGIFPLSEDEFPNFMSGIIVRVKPGEGKQFIDSLTGDDLEFGNVFIEPFKSFEDMKYEAEGEGDMYVRNCIICMLFLVICVFMGLFGTFWLRTSQNTAEIAIRKVNGATPADIMRRYFGEGLLLLFFATVIALPVEYWLYKTFMNEESETFPITLNNDYTIYGFIAATVLMVIIVLLSIWIPARRAMRINPSSALKSE